MIGPIIPSLTLLMALVLFFQERIVLSGIFWLLGAGMEFVRIEVTE